MASPVSVPLKLIVVHVDWLVTDIGTNRQLMLPALPHQGISPHVHAFADDISSNARARVAVIGNT